MPISSDGEIDLIIHNLFPIRVWTTCGPRIGADAAIVVGEPHLALNDTGVEFNDAVLPGGSELAEEQQKKKNWHNQEVCNKKMLYTPLNFGNKAS